MVIENIHRHLRMGEPPKEAALNGRSEIGLAAMTITLVDVVVFVPIAFMGGIVGQFFKPVRHRHRDGHPVLAVCLLHPDADAGLALAEEP